MLFPIMSSDSPSRDEALQGVWSHLSPEQQESILKLLAQLAYKCHAARDARPSDNIPLSLTHPTFGSQTTYE